jgi:hypothetical protein
MGGGASGKTGKVEATGAGSGIAGGRNRLTG